MGRREQILSMFDPSGFGLEIGPSYNPLLAKADGFNVETLDHASYDELVAKYQNDPAVDAARIEPIDYVSDGRSMLEVIGTSARYDFIVASHVIEHVPNPVGFLRECEAMLKPDGVIVLAVPDKRYCFDHFRPISTTGQILQAHWENRTRHTRAARFDQNAHYCEIDGRGGWSAENSGSPRLRFGLQQALAGGGVWPDDRYVDCHGWQFVPSSFRLIVSDLIELGELTVREAAFCTGLHFEFFVTLSRAGAGSNLSRQAMMEAVLQEQAEPAIGKAAFKRGSWVTSDHYRDVLADRNDLRRQLAEAQSEVAALRGSTSWRITKPLRALKGG